MGSIITVKDLSKKYTIGHQKQGDYQTLRDSLSHGARSIYQRLRHPFSPNSEEIDMENFWALKDINFDIQQGDRLGIIGRNGAGKSTLLKILSRITHPTTGEIHIKGRVASLLEVGTGFHPELTGRENIFLNGAILGMTKNDIRLRYDEIVSFAEVEKFLDTPVKRYSSGMYVRLAFAVAAHLEPEILVVDEVLAVGDAEFQKKCLGKMGEISQGGRTIIFVSHNMNAIEKMCNKGIVLKKGTLEFESDKIHDLISNYLTVSNIDYKSVWNHQDNSYNHPCFTPKKFFLSSSVDDKPLSAPILNKHSTCINLEFEVDQTDKALEIGYRVYSVTDEFIYSSLATDDHEKNWPKIKQGHNEFKTLIPAHFLNEGDYRIELVASLFQREWILEPMKHDINLFLSIRGGLSNSPYWLKKRGGYMAPIFQWQSESTQSY